MSKYILRLNIRWNESATEDEISTLKQRLMEKDCLAWDVSNMSDCKGESGLVLISKSQISEVNSHARTIVRSIAADVGDKATVTTTYCMKVIAVEVIGNVEELLN